MKLLSQLLGKSKVSTPLTTKQYVAARDAGFTMQELEGKDATWYGNNRDEITYKAEDTIKPRQIALLKTEGFEIDVQDVSFYDARKAMRQLAKDKDEDKRYIDAILAIEKDYADRKIRKRAQKAEEQQDSEEIQAAWTHYRKEYKRKFGASTVEVADAHLVDLINSTLGKIGLEALKKAITYCIHVHDHGKFAVSLRDLLTKDWLLNVCIQGSADATSTRRKAQEAGMTEVEYRRAERRGDFMDGQSLSAAREEAIKCVLALASQKGLTGQEKRNFKARPEFIELFKTVSELADSTYIANAVAIANSELQSLQVAQ